MRLTSKSAPGIGQCKHGWMNNYDVQYSIINSCRTIDTKTSNTAADNNDCDDDNDNNDDNNWYSNWLC